MRLRYLPRPLVLALTMLMMVSAHSSAQSTAILTGTVLDPSGGLVPDAEVTCRNVDTGLTSVVTTTKGGLFRFTELPVGPYELTVKREGFDRLVRSGIQLLTGQTADLSLTLKVGGTNQSVEVSAPAPLVQSTTSELQTTVDSRQMADLPLNGRNAFDLAVLTAGAVETDAGTVPGQQDNNAVAVNGLRSTQNNWELDGGSYTNRMYGSAPTLPNPDTLQEFTARTSTFSAENKGAGAIVKLTTRSGTNRFHGSLFEFLRNERMDARNFFSIRAEKYKHNQYGGTLGGPIRKDRLFFFGSLQGTNKRGSPSPRTLTVPSAEQRTGDFTRSGKTIIDPGTTAPFPGNVIPSSRFDPIGVGLLKQMAMPNFSSNTLLMAPPDSRNDYQWMVKLDYMLGSKDQISGRYFWDRNTGQRDVSSLPGFHASNAYLNQTLLISNTHTFSPSWVSKVSFNYLKTHRTESPVTPVTMQALGAKIPLAVEEVPDKINVNITGYTRLFSGRGLAFHPSSHEFQADLNHFSGAHLLRFGGGLRNNAQYAVNYGDERGSWTFNAQRTSSAAVRNSGDAIAGMLLGLPSNFSESSTAPQQFISRSFDLWLQDDWKIHRRLTFNLGVRWDPWLPARDQWGVVPGFLPGVRSTLAPLAPLGLVFSGDPGIPDAVLSNKWNTLAPRFGFALDVFGNGRTVVRGGYGLFRPTPMFGFLRGVANSAPTRSASVSIPSPPSTATPFQDYQGTLPFPFKAPERNQLSQYVFPSNMSLLAFDPTARSGYTQSWNFTIERQLLRDTGLSISYVGNHFLAGLTRYNANPAIYGPAATNTNVNARRRYQGFSDITLGTSVGNGYYHGLQVQVTKRAQHGLTVLGNYTWGKAMDTESSGDFGGAGGESARNPFNLNLDKGPADFDVAHQAKIAVLYELPRIRGGNRILRALTNTWQTNAILIARTGFAFTCRSGVDNSLSGVGNDTCDQVDPNIARPAGVDPLKMWFNTAAFTTNAIGTFGSVGRNSLRRPGFVNLNFSLFRRIRVTEKVSAEIRGEAFNALNHANFDLFYSPNGYQASLNVGSPTFGQVVHARDPRLMQIALKLKF